IEEIFRLLDPLFGHMLSDERHLGDVQAESFSEVIEHAVAANDAAPSCKGCNSDMHLARAACGLRNEITGQQKWNVFRKRQPQAAREQQPEEDEISARHHVGVEILWADQGKKVHYNWPAIGIAAAETDEFRFSHYEC